LGLRYDDECFTYGVGFSESRDLVTDVKTRTIGVNVSLRTLTDFQTDFTLP
jgi:hypothetical protein